MVTFYFQRNKNQTMFSAFKLVQLKPDQIVDKTSMKKIKAYNQRGATGCIIYDQSIFKTLVSEKSTLCSIIKKSAMPGKMFP